MLKNSRSICLDICDYENNAVCNIYDNTADLSGQATDVYVRTERNGWKELSFNIPSTCFTEDGEEENFRLQYLIADYRIRLITDEETDWYLVSESKITHDKKAKNTSVTAGHIAQLLKTRNLDLEFSDEEGNNVGSADQLLKTILEGTDWIPGNVATFYEDDGVTIKKRSLNASANTGAFKLIEDMCELFDAKPVYHGEWPYIDEEGNEKIGRVVDIVPMNPFSKELEPGEIPAEVYNDLDVLEIHYDKNLQNITRTVNTETLVTRLYAYGSYGDENGICSIQTCFHDEYILSSGDYPSGTEFTFRDKDGAAFYFTIDEDITSGSELIYSKLDFMSRSYVWNKTTRRAYHVYKTRKTLEPVELATTLETKKNYFPFLLSFNYYEETGLLSESMFQQLAAYQQALPAYYIQGEEAAAEMIANEQKLSEILESNTGMAKLAVRDYGDSDGKLVLYLDTNQGDHGILYRTDYDEAKRNYFEWHVAKQLKDNGDPLSGIGSVVYIVHDTDPVTWEIAYVKNIMDDNGNVYVNDKGEPKDFDYGLNDTEPGSLTLWLDRGDFHLSDSDRFYLFCSMSMSGKLSAKQVSDEAVLASLQNETTVSTEKHPTYFSEISKPMPSTSPILNSYGWCYRYSSTTLDKGELYFCFGSRGESSWHKVYAQETVPEVENDAYFFHLRTKAFYHGVSGEWVQLETAEDKRIAIQLSKVIYYCRQRDMTYHGIYEKYSYKANPVMNRGNYAFASPYEFFWCATTDRDIPLDETVTVDTVKGLLWQDSDIQHVVPTRVVSYDSATFPVSNELANTSYFPGMINTGNGVEEDSSSFYRTINIKGYEDTIYEYDLPEGSYVVCYNIDKVFCKDGVRAASGTGTFITPGDTYYMRVVSPTIPSDTNFVRIHDYSNYLYLSNKPYRIYYPLEIKDDSNELVGINPLMKKFADLADLVYDKNHGDLRKAQDKIKEEDNKLAQDLGDLLREGYWQESNFVEGDEEKMYTDSIDNLKEISKPEITYDITYLDLYSANRGQGYSIDEVDDIDWPDIKITDAVHLVDPEININQWAYIDAIDKCYDQPWLTTLDINTKLSLIDQHDFADVLARIAEVANETKGKQSIYKRAAALSSSGTLASNLLDGNIKANKALLLGGSSNWYTDQKGNIILEAEDGSGAMMLTGKGLMIASDRDVWGDWNFRSALTGQGLTADEVVTAFLSAKDALIGSITTDMIHASVGQELEIGSNRALMFYATTSGDRPAGGVKTGLHNADGTYSEVGEGDSYIEIGAKETTDSGVNPAYINIMTGGMMNIYSGSDMNIKSNANLNIESEGTFNIQSGGDMKILSGGSLQIVTDPEGSGFAVDSPNFKVLTNGNVEVKGTIYALAGEIAGFTIARETTQDGELKRGYIYSGTDSMSSTANGVYIGTDGVNLSGYLKVSKDGAVATFGSAGLYIDAASGKMDINGGAINITADSDFNISAGKTLTLVTNETGNVKIGNSGSPFTIGSDGTNAYIYNGATAIPANPGTGKDGVYLGTDGLYIQGTANTVRHYIKATKDGTIDISGKITADEGSIGGINIHKNYGLYTGNKTSADSTDDGFLIHKDGEIYLGAYDPTSESCPFQITSDGTLTATKGTVGGWHISRTHIGNNADISNSSIGLASNATGSNVAIWAGSTNRNSANFQVTADGTITAKGAIEATSGKVGAWTITSMTDKNKPGLLYAGSGTSYVGLDGSNKTYPLSGLNDGEKHMYAIWAGAANPQDAKFSVTKDGIVTIQRLRIKKSNGVFDEIDFSNWTSSEDPTDVDINRSMGKLKFQTIKKVTKNDATGQVYIYTTNDSGGTTIWDFNTATSVKLGEGTWSSATEQASARYKALAYYKSGEKDVTVEEKDVVGVTGEWNYTGLNPSATNKLFIRGTYLSHPDTGFVNLFYYSFDSSVGTWNQDTHKATVSVKMASGLDEEAKVDILHITANASDVFKQGHDNGAESIFLTTRAGISTDTVQATVSGGEKLVIVANYYPQWKSSQSETATPTGATYVVQGGGAAGTYIEGWNAACAMIKKEDDVIFGPKKMKETDTEGVAEKKYTAYPVVSKGQPWGKANLYTRTKTPGGTGSWVEHDYGDETDIVTFNNTTYQAKADGGYWGWTREPSASISWTKHF